MELPPLLNPFDNLADDAPCWCQSGKQFGQCHKNRDSQRRAKPQEALSLLSKQFQKKIGCLHPSAPQGCEGKIIASHTIQRSGPLRAIATNGEVYSMRGATSQIVENGGKLVPQRRGISTVSTFPGFCSKHDNEFFAPIENGDFEINSQNCFLLHYRSICSELHAKTSMQFGNQILSLMDGGREEFDQFFAQQFAADMNFGASLAEQELIETRESLIEAWSKSDFSNLKFHFIEFDTILPFVTSFSATPQFSLGGQFVQDLSEERLRGVTLSSTVINGRTGFVFCSTDVNLMRLLTAELSDQEIGTPSTLLRWVMANAENVAFRIDWWDHLADRRKKHLLDMMMIGLPFGGPDDEPAAYHAAVEVLPLAKVYRSLSF